VKEMEEKLSTLRSGVVLVKAEDKKNLRFYYFELIFLVIYESFYCSASPLKSLLMLLQEELGLEYDEDVGVSLQSCTELINPGKRRKTAR
ncbi:hypothetical protein B296_00040975, partial [Ensete ventricosum]